MDTYNVGTYVVTVFDVGTIGKTDLIALRYTVKHTGGDSFLDENGFYQEGFDPEPYSVSGWLLTEICKAAGVDYYTQLPGKSFVANCLGDVDHCTLGDPRPILKTK